MVKRRQTEEGALTSAARVWFERHGILFWRMPVGPVIHRTGSGENVKTAWKKNPLKGFPDYAGVLRRRHRGVLWTIELKASEGELTSEQIVWMTTLRGAGVACAVCRSIKEIENAMRVWGEIA